MKAGEHHEPTAIDEASEYSVEEKDSRRLRRGVLAIITVTVAAFLYCLFLDSLVISHSVVEPLKLSIDHRLPGSSNAQYRLYMDWDNNEQRHPDLFLDDSVPVPVNKDNALPMPLESSRILKVSLAPGVAGGMHRGQLRLFRYSGASTLPEGASIPVALEIKKSPLSNLEFTTSLLLILVFFAVLLYIGFTVAIPRPYGHLVFADPLEPGVPHRSIPLKMRRSALLFPPRRNILPLKYLWRKHRIRPAMRSDARLEFLTRFGDPQLIIRRKGGGAFQRMNEHDWKQSPFDQDAGKPVKERSVMRRNRGYLYRSHRTGGMVKFRFDDRGH